MSGHPVLRQMVRAKNIYKGRVELIVGGKRKRLPRTMWHRLRGPRPGDGYSCDGCTMSPDRLLGGFQVWPACAIHDLHYSGKVKGMTRWMADTRLATNLWRILRMQGCWWPRALLVALVYFTVVRMLGHRHYKGE